MVGSVCLCSLSPTAKTPTPVISLIIFLVVQSSPLDDDCDDDVVVDVVDDDQCEV